MSPGSVHGASYLLIHLTSPHSRQIWATFVAQLVKNPPANSEDLGSIPGSERSPGEGNGNPLQYACLGNPTDRGAWWATVHGGHKTVRHELATKPSPPQSRQVPSSSSSHSGKTRGTKRLRDVPEVTRHFLWLQNKSSSMKL